MLNIKHISDWEAASEYQEQWNKIVMQDEGDEYFNSTLFQTYEWNRLWWKSFSTSEDKLLILLAFEESELIGIAPLMITPRKSFINKKIVHFIGVNGTLYSSDFCSFIAHNNRQKIIRLFLNWLEDHRHLWDLIEFYNVPENPNDFQTLHEIFNNRLHIMSTNEAPSRILNEKENYDDLVNSFSTHNANNKLNSLKKKGNISYEYLNSIEDIKNNLTNFFDLHVERRALTPYPSYFQSEKHRNFYTNMVELISPNGWIILMTLNVNNLPVSYQFCFEFNNKLYFYTPSFDVKYKKFSVGYIHIVKIFEYILQKKYKEVSFGAGAEEYKYRYANKTTKIVSLLIFNKQSSYIVYKIKLSCINAIKTVVRKIQKIFT